MADEPEIVSGPGAPSGDNPLSGMLAQVQQMQQEMMAAQQALAESTVEGRAGAGLVTATVSGSGELRSVRIAREAVDPDDVEMLEDLVTAAVGEALRKAQALQQERLGAAGAGIDLGGLGDGLGGLFG